MAVTNLNFVKVRSNFIQIVKWRTRKNACLKVVHQPILVIKIIAYLLLTESGANNTCGSCLAKNKAFYAFIH